MGPGFESLIAYTNKEVSMTSLFRIHIRAPPPGPLDYKPFFISLTRKRSLRSLGGPPGRGLPGPYPFFILLRKTAPLHSAWRPSGSAVSLQAFARTNTFVPALVPAWDFFWGVYSFDPANELAGYPYLMPTAYVVIRLHLRRCAVRHMVGIASRFNSWIFPNITRIPAW